MRKPGSALPVIVGLIGCVSWIASEAIERMADGFSNLSILLTGIGIVGVSVMPFELIRRQGHRAYGIAYFGAFLVSVGAFILGASDFFLIGTGITTEQTQLNQASPLFLLAAFSLVIGSLLFSASVLMNQYYARWSALLVSACAIGLSVVSAANLPQYLASASNVLLCIALLSMGIKALKEQSSF